MTQQTINVGANANDRKGDSLRIAFQKVNANFTELFNSGGGSGDRLVNGSRSLVLAANGAITISGDIRSENNINIEINLADSTLQRWQFGEDGSLTLPASGNIRQNLSFTRTTSATAAAATATVVWSANQDWTSAIKLTIQVEGRVTGDSTGWHVQTSEATIASRGYANNINGYGDPEMSVYGIIYTSVSPLATFEVQRNATTRLVELVATGTDLNNNIIVSIHSVEIGTTD